MKKLLVCLDDETFNLLDGDANKSATIRSAIKLYKSDISTDSIEGLRRSYLAVGKQLKEIDSKLDYLAR